MLAARIAALAAPKAPIAKVPTGTPLGIWTIDKSESTPRSVLLSTGTPSTGKIVNAAIIPGKCAAPPAPAMMTSRPLCSADSAYSTNRFGVRCAETTFASCGTPNSSNNSAAAHRFPIRHASHRHADQRLFGWMIQGVPFNKTSESSGLFAFDGPVLRRAFMGRIAGLSPVCDGSIASKENRLRTMLIA